VLIARRALYSNRWLVRLLEGVISRRWRRQCPRLGASKSSQSRGMSI